jgi:hypothetical protein
MLLAYLLTTAQPPDNVVLSETEPESDKEVTMRAAGPSALSTVLPPDDLSVTEPESDEEPPPATVGMQIISHRLPLPTNKAGQLQAC